MKAAGYDVRETDPLEPAQTFAMLPQAVPPIVFDLLENEPHHSGRGSRRLSKC